MIFAQIPGQDEKDKGPPSIFPTVPVWTLSLNSQIVVPPAFGDSHAYFSIEGDLVVAYSMPEGEQRWLVTSRPLVRPVAGEGLLFVVEQGFLTARRAADGSIAWQLPFTDALAVPPVWDNGWLVAATRAGTILAFRGSDGHLVWTHEVGSKAHAAPALAADHVYIPTDDGRVVTLRIDTGEEVWRRRLGGPANDILALDDRLFVGSVDHYLYCLATDDGRVRWRWRTGGDVIGAPVVDEKQVFFVSLDNVLRSLSRKNGVQQWIRPLPIRPTTGPVHAAGTIIVSGVAPLLRGYKTKDGTDSGDLATVNELAAPIQLIERAGSPVPWFVYVTRDIAKGVTVTLAKRTFEPDIQPIGPLINPVVLPLTLEPETPATDPATEQ